MASQTLPHTEDSDRILIGLGRVRCSITSRRNKAAAVAPLWTEAVAHAGLGEQVHRPGRVHFEFLLLNQIAASWASYTDFDPTEPTDRDKFLRNRRTAVVTAVERLFPASRQP